MPRHRLATSSFSTIAGVQATNCRVGDLVHLFKIGTLRLMGPARECTEAAPHCESDTAEEGTTVRKRWNLSSWLGQHPTVRNYHPPQCYSISRSVSVTDTPGCEFGPLLPLLLAAFMPESEATIPDDIQKM